MATARTIIRRAMQKAGILTKTEVPSADEADDALDSLNDLLGLVSNENLMLYTRRVQNFPLVAGKSSYTIGIGGQFNTARPMKIASAYVRIGNIDYPLEQIRDVKYDNTIPLKTLPTIPYGFAYDNAYPLATITLYPVPASDWQLYIRTEDMLGQFTLDEAVDLPPGWNQYLVYKLATILQPEYGQPIDPNLNLLANQAKLSLEIGVAKNRTMDAEPIGVSKFNIWTGQGY